MYRIGKKQKRAILTADGNEVVVFPKGKEALAKKVCNLLNAELEVNKISSSAVLAVSVLPNELQDIINCMMKADDFDNDKQKAMYYDIIQKDLRKYFKFGKTDR